MTSNFSCTGCKYDLPGDCANKQMGTDGYWHFPEGDCWKESSLSIPTSEGVYMSYTKFHHLTHEELLRQAPYGNEAELIEELQNRLATVIDLLKEIKIRADADISELENWLWNP